MSGAMIINGKEEAAAFREKIAGEVSELKNSKGVEVGLAVILVGDDPASAVYVRNKIKACENTGIKSFEQKMGADSSQEEIRHVIRNLNKNPDVHGILLQLPLPSHLDENELIQEIAPEKDVDGLTVASAGRLFSGIAGLVPCTPQGSLHLIKSVETNLSGMDAVVIGRSLLFGKPMAQLLLAENCTVTQAHSRTKDLPELCKRADILVAAVGRPKMVKGDWVKEGAIVIDVGINRLDDGSLCGDVDYDEASKVARAITPVPGGVGPMTIAYLLKNTVEAARTQAGS
jgi:methylenetetrahydrofolate dehydrogenase (NADP+)/methenyltetrahydrofolate cyclohydrolase